MIGLKWIDCDLDRAVAQTKIKGGNIVVRPLSTSLVKIIERQQRCTEFVFTYNCRKTRGTRKSGERLPMTETALRKRFDEARRKAEITNFRFHDLRHTAATRILRSTQNLAVTKEALKHSNIKTTLRYAHVLDNDVRDALTAAESRNSPEASEKSALDS